MLATKTPQELENEIGSEIASLLSLENPMTERWLHVLDVARPEQDTDVPSFRLKRASEVCSCLCAAWQVEAINGVGGGTGRHDTKKQ